MLSYHYSEPFERSKTKSHNFIEEKHIYFVSVIGIILFELRPVNFGVPSLERENEQTKVTKTIDYMNALFNLFATKWPVSAFVC